MTEYYSGCNIRINIGKTIDTPIGTATSIHNCNKCERVNYCQLKQDSEVFLYDEQISKKMDCAFEIMIQSEIHNKERNLC